jgi:hypothetical protein
MSTGKVEAIAQSPAQSSRVSKVTVGIVQSSQPGREDPEGMCHRNARPAVNPDTVPERQEKFRQGPNLVLVADGGANLRPGGR